MERPRGWNTCTLSLHSSHVTLYNYFGPTEASVYATGKHVLRSELPGRMTSIGKPLPNVTCYVVDPSSTASPLAPMLQPIGVWGELWLGGVQVATALRVGRLATG